MVLVLTLIGFLLNSASAAFAEAYDAAETEEAETAAETVIDEECAAAEEAAIEEAETGITEAGAEASEETEEEQEDKAISVEETEEDLIPETEVTEPALLDDAAGGDGNDPGTEPESEPETEEDPVVTFVTRLYNVCLDREPDEGGLNDWSNRLKTGAKTGVQVARGFVFSKEFKNRNFCDRCYVKQLYRAFMGREYDTAGLNDWVSKLKAGKTRQSVFNGFSQSREFRAICEEYGITAGGKIDLPAYVNYAPAGACSICGAPAPQKYTIKYVLNGGTNSKSNPPWYVTSTAKLTLQKPTRRGYTFKSWYSDKALTKKQSTIAAGTTGNKTFYAGWTLNEYAITYVLDKGTNNSGNPSLYAVTTDTITLKAPTKPGYKFRGWYSDAGFTNRVTSIPKGSVNDITLYAKWEAVTYNITYVMDGGTNRPENRTTYSAEDLPYFHNPSKEGYYFKGWSLDPDPKKTSYVRYPPRDQYGDITVYARWGIIKYYVVFDGNGATSGSMDAVQHTWGKTYTLPENAFKRTGDTFIGWNTEKDGTGVFYSNKELVKNINNTRKDIRLYAQWKNYRNVSYSAYDTQAGPVVFVTNNHPELQAHTNVTIRYYIDDDVIGEETLQAHTGVGLRSAVCGSKRSSEYTSFEVSISYDLYAPGGWERLCDRNFVDYLKYTASTNESGNGVYISIGQMGRIFEVDFAAVFYKDDEIIGVGQGSYMYDYWEGGPGDYSPCEATIGFPVDDDGEMIVPDRFDIIVNSAYYEHGHE